MPGATSAGRPYSADDDAAVRTAVRAADFARIAEQIGSTRASVEQRARYINHRIAKPPRPTTPPKPRRRYDDEPYPIDHAAVGAAIVRWEKAAARDDGREFRNADNALGLLLSRTGPYRMRGYVYRYDRGEDGVVRNVAARRRLAG